MDHLVKCHFKNGVDHDLPKSITFPKLDRTPWEQLFNELQLNTVNEKGDQYSCRTMKDILTLILFAKDYQQDVDPHTSKITWYC